MIKITNEEKGNAVMKMLMSKQYYKCVAKVKEETSEIIDVAAKDLSSNTIDAIISPEQLVEQDVIVKDKARKMNER